jgi:succinoglycan biosynthesis transport protein ExoP
MSFSLFGWLRSPGVEPIQLSSVLVLVRRRFAAILIPAVLVAGAALLLALEEEKRYEATTFLLVRDATVDAQSLASEATSREVRTNIDLLKRGTIEDRVDRRLGEPFSGGVQVLLERDRSSLATIVVTDTDPDRAAEVANAYAEEYIELRRETHQAEIEEQREAIRAELDSTGGGGPAANALRERLKELSLAAIAPSGVVQFNRAEPPTGAVAPKPLQNTLIGAAIGLALGLALAIALEQRDRRLRDPRQLEQVLGRPILGRIPRSRALAKAGPGTGALPPAEAEAFRTVRANLSRLLSERPAPSLLVTSAIPNEGKTTLAWNLARVEATAGNRVLLVEADMRRPVLAHGLGANGAPGLSQLLAGDAKLPELVQPVEGFGDRRAANGSGPRGSLDVLFAGRPPTNPAELLDSRRMQALLEVAPEGYDLVILDTPPAVVSDAMPILDRVGGVVVVGRLGLTTGESLLELRDRLDNLQAPILGVVVNAGLWSSLGIRRGPARKASP